MVLRGAQTWWVRFLLCSLFVLIAQEVSTPITHAQVNTPSVNRAAFHGQGHVAFAWNSTPYILDGVHDTMHALPGKGATIRFAWSVDGLWLAYTVATSPAAPSSLWVVFQDGSAPHHIAGLPSTIEAFSWASSDTLSVTTNGIGNTINLWLTSPSKVLKSVKGIPGSSGLWSPDQKMIAYVTTVPATDPTMRSDVLFTRSVDDTAQGVARVRAPHAGIVLTTWWLDSRGLVYFTDPWHSASLATEGLPLFSTALDGTPHQLGVTFSYKPLALALLRKKDEVLFAQGGAMQKADGKALTTCTLMSGRCRTLPTQKGYAILDPVWESQMNPWAMENDRVAFVQGPETLDIAHFSTAATGEAWGRSTTLWIGQSDGSHLQHLQAAGTGIIQPQWSNDGNHLMYIRDNAVWLLGIKDSAPVKILGPFPKEADIVWALAGAGLVMEGHP